MTVSKFRKRNFLSCAHLLHKAGARNRTFHVAVVQQRLRNVQKSVMHVQSCFFSQSKPIDFLLFAVVVATPYCCDPKKIATMVT